MLHEVERGLDLVSALGMETHARELRLVVPDTGRDEAFAALAQLGINRDHQLIVVHPGCSMPARTYPWEQFAEVAQRLAEQYQATVVLTGVAGERELAERVRERAGERYWHAIHSLAGELSFPALCALIEAADLTITNNTGPMHVSAAVGTPVVALFALTNPPEQWGPWQVPHRLLNHDVPCRICYSRACPYGHECLALVSPAEVVAAAGELLRESKGTVPATAYAEVLA
jgi:ADP-heptose:LPS heptosyltransferase